MVRVRFAPSPTGFLHVGNVRTALYNWLFARRQAGVFLLRIEDTDAERSAREYEEQLIADLRWLGLHWDEGPEAGGPSGPYRQTERLDVYREHAQRLLASEHAYYCFCSPAELEKERELQLAAGGQPRYSGRCRGIPRADAVRRVASGEAAAVRLRVRTGTVGFLDMVFGRVDVDCAVIGDPVLLRSDGTANYNFAVVVDDALMRISHVIRGEGHLSNTHRQLLVYEACGWEPPRFAHLSTILGSDGSKLSKRHGATSIREFREAGYLPEALVNYLALLGWSPPGEGNEILSLQKMVELFDMDRVSRSPAIFDPEKLNWVNRSHLRTRPPADLVPGARAFLIRAGLLHDRADAGQDRLLEMILEATLNYLDRLDQIAGQSHFLFRFPVENLAAGSPMRDELSPEAISVIRSFSTHISSAAELDAASYKSAVAAVKAETGQKGRQLFHPIRIALTAEHSGPELDRLVPILEFGKRLDLPVPILGCRERVSAVLAMLAPQP